MTGELLALGVSHKTAPLALRERLALPEGRAARVLAELTAHDAVHEAVAISTCNRTELYLVTADPVEAENAALGVLSRQAGDPPDRAARLALLAARPRGGRAPVLGHRRARLDDRRRGRGPGPGQARLRARARRGRDRAGHQPPLPRRARRRQARAHRDRRRRARACRCPSVAVELAADFLGDLAERRVLVIGAGENGELTARALRDRGVQTLFVANRRYDRAIGLAQRFGGAAVAFDDLPARARAGRHRRHLHRRAAPDRRPRGAGVRGGARAGPAARADRHRRAARHRPERARLPGITLYDMDDLQREVARNLGGREAEAEEALVLVREEVERFEALAREPRRRADDRGAARARRRDRRRRCCARTSRAGSRSPTPTASGSRVMARAVVSRLLHEPTRAPQGAAGEGTPTATCTRCASCSGSRPRWRRTRRRPPRSPELDARRRRRGRLIRLGTRGSALALAQAELGAPSASADEVELVTITTVAATAASDATDKARFVKEIEEALLAGEIDLAVHSAKDVPGELPDGLAIVGVPERADARDALCGAAVARRRCAEGAVVGTAQPAPPRRAAGPAARPRGARAARQRRHPAAPARRRATSTRSCWRAPASSGSGAPREGRRCATSWCRRRARAAWRSRRATATRRGRARPRALTDRAALHRLTAERALVTASARPATRRSAPTPRRGRRRARLTRVRRACPTARTGSATSSTGPAASPPRSAATWRERLLAAGARPSCSARG